MSGMLDAGVFRVEELGIILSLWDPVWLCKSVMAVFYATRVARPSAQRQRQGLNGGDLVLVGWGEVLSRCSPCYAWRCSVWLMQ